MNNICIIYNPASGRFKQKTLVKLKREFEALGHTVSTQATSITTQLSVKKDCSLICVVGGDGTLRLVISALLDLNLNVALCIFAGGTINLVARELNYPRNPKKFARYISTGLGREEIKYNIVPILLCSLGPIICSFSIGPDSLAVHNISLATKRRIGRLAYAVSMFQILMKWPVQKFSVCAKIDGRIIIDTHVSALFIAKGRFYAGPWSFAHKASLTAPNFQMLLLKNATKVDFLVFLLSLILNRKLRNSKRFQTLEATEVDLKFSEKAVVQVDGDAMELDGQKLKFSDKKMLFIA